MEGKIIEAAHGPDEGNWGKFEVCRPDTEWERRSAVDTTARRPLLAQRGWTRDFVWVLDWETGEGVCVRPGGSARADLGKHRVSVCPLFEPFLEWLYRQGLTDLQALPDLVYLPGAPFAQYGYRRGGQGKLALPSGPLALPSGPLALPATTPRQPVTATAGTTTTEER